MTYELIVVVLLILLNGFFAMSELAIVSARRTRLRQLADDGHEGAKLALELAEDPASFLSIVQIGMTLNSVFAGAYSGATLAGHLTDYLNSYSWIAPHGEAAALALTIMAVTYVNLVVGELLPKRIGLSYAEPIAIRVSYIMRLFATIAAPIVWMLKQSTEIVLNLFGLAKVPDNVITEEEVKDLIAEGAESGVFKQAEKVMLESVMRLADRTVRSIMTPRVDMVWLDIDDASDKHVRVIRHHPYSCFPVARGDLEEILGIIYAKDILDRAFDGQPVTVKGIMRQALIVPDTTHVLRLVEQFKQSGQYIAIIADEYGSVEGLVSITDILEAITGDLPEAGQESATPPVHRSDGSWLLDGMTPIDEVESLLSVKGMQGSGDFHTLAGFVIEQLGRLPTTGDKATWQDFRFEVVDMDARRVDKVLIIPPARQGEDEIN
ncbi:MAG: HlyC/CorC family transporter [Alphaproteobacteria bacterium]|nr:HlyC/CorC family transporter [Alphaproteobacteria bacterium]